MSTVVAADPVVERTDLGGGSWIDVVRGLLPSADDVHASLLESTSWQQGRVFRYEKWIDEPRLGAWQRGANRHPALQEVEAWLTARYRVSFGSEVGLARYRNERDSVAWHRDRELRWLDDTVIGILTMGAGRPFLLRPMGPKRMDARDMTGVLSFRPMSGDAVVMGGRCQAAWLHTIPKLQTRCLDRISAQWRWTSKRGAPDTNPSYYAPRRFSR